MEFPYGEVVLKPLVVPEFVHVSEDLTVQEADLGLHRRFALACGEIKYFKPDAVVTTKPSSRALDNNTVRSKSVSPKRCNCSWSHEEINKKRRWPVELQSTARSVYQSTGTTADHLTVINVEDERSFTPANSVNDDVDDSVSPLGEDYRNIPTPDLASSRDGSFSETEEESTMDDDSSYHSTPSDSITLCTPADESRESPTASSIKSCSLREDFPNNLELKEEGGSKPVLIGVNSKREFQNMFNNEACSNFDTPKSRDMSSSQLSTLVDDTERDVAGDAEERRKSLISAAIAADLPKFTWGDLESVQVLSRNDMNIDSKSAAFSEEFREDVGLDVAQEVVDQEVGGFGYPHEGREQRAVFSLGQQTDCSGFVVGPKSNSQEEVGVAVAVQTSPEEISTGLGENVKVASQDVASAEVLISQTSGSGGLVSFAEAPKVDKHALKDLPGNAEVPISNDMALVPVTVEAELRPDNIGEQKAGEGMERFRQRLWCYLLENMNRAIDELYFLCELESDVEQIKKALLVLDEAGADFKDLKARVDGFDPVNKDPELPRPASVASTSTSISSKGDLQQRRPHAITWEVRRMTCSQEQADMLSSSLVALKKVHGSPQSGTRLQDRRQADTSDRKKESSSSDAQLVTISVDPASRKPAPSSSSMYRFMSPMASSEQRASSRERQLNVPTGSKTALEAWKEKRNWEDILSSRLSGSPGPGQESTERVRVLHNNKFMLPKRKRRSPFETKKISDGKQARATRIHLELENGKVQQRLQKRAGQLCRVTSEWQAVRSNKLRGGLQARQQLGKSRLEAHLAQIARRTTDESSKVSEIRFITSVNEENKKLVLQQKLQGSERGERLQSLRLKQKQGIAKEEPAQGSRYQLEAERLYRIAEVQQRKGEAKARREEERKAREALEHVRKKEAWATGQQEEVGQKLSDKLRESSLRRESYLEQIKERAMVNFDKQDKRSREMLSEFSVWIRDQGSPSGRRTSSREKVPLDNEIEMDVLLGRRATGSRGQTDAGLISLVGDEDSTSLLSSKTRVKRIRQRLTSRKIEYYEPPGVEGRGLGTATVTRGVRSKVGRWMQVQAMRKPGSLTTSGLIISEIIKYLEGREPELHAARQQGLIDYISTALPASHSSKPETSPFTVALL